MGLWCPVESHLTALRNAGMGIDDIDLYAGSAEAFARCSRGARPRVLNIPMDKVNVNGGAIAVKAPFGDRRITSTLINSF